MLRSAVWIDVEIAIGEEALLVAFEVGRHSGFLRDCLEGIVHAADGVLFPLISKVYDLQGLVLHVLASAILKFGLILDDDDTT